MVVPTAARPLIIKIAAVAAAFALVTFGLPPSSSAFFVSPLKSSSDYCRNRHHHNHVHTHCDTHPPPTAPVGDEDDDPATVSSGWRRAALARIFSGGVGGLTIAGVAMAPPSPVAVARNLPLSTGAKGDQTGTVKALIPIIQLRNSLAEVQTKLEAGSNDSSSSDTTMKAVWQVLERTVPREEVAFKRLFDEYSDPVSYKQKFLDQNAFLVYYTKGFDGPNRPNIESDESGAMQQRQTMQFGARNEAWVCWNDLQAELTYVQQNPNNNDSDVRELCKKTLQAVQAYLILAPPTDLATAEKFVLAN